MSLLAKRVAEEAKQSPTAISLPKSALLGYSSEILRKTSLAFCLLYFSVATKYSKKRSTYQEKRVQFENNRYCFLL